MRNHLGKKKSRSDFLRTHSQLFSRALRNATMSDPRRDWLARCALDALGANERSSTRSFSRSSQELLHSVHASSALDDFLEQSSVRTLQVSAVGGDGGGPCELVCSTAVGLSRAAVGAADGAAVVFTKRSSEPLTAENIASAVIVNSLGGSPLHALQLQIKQLYSPMLLGDPAWSSQLDARTRSTLEALETALESAVQLGVHLSSDADYSNILTPWDECAHWRSIDGGGMPNADAEARRHAKEFWEILRPISEQLGVFFELPFGEMERLLKELQSALDALFQAGYKEARMAHFLRLIGTSLDGYVKKRLAELNLFTAPFRKAARALRDSCQVTDES